MKKLPTSVVPKCGEVCASREAYFSVLMVADTFCATGAGSGA
jgi:hypothetical protein